MNGEQPFIVHQVVADGVVIYEGDDWQQAFLEASKNPDYGTIVHLENGEPGAQWWPVIHKEDEEPPL